MVSGGPSSDTAERGREISRRDGRMRRPRTLGAFVLDRISEEETAALDCRGWFRGEGDPPGPDRVRTPESFAAFVLAHDPDRVLTECVARRRIVKRLTSPNWSGSAEEREALLGLIALPYASHPAFLDEWRHDTGTSGHYLHPH
jgi:hypothetical protein